MPMLRSKESTLRTIVRMQPALLGAAVVAVLGLLAFRYLHPFGDLHPSNNEVGNYLQTVGTIYGVLLAFVMSAVWAQFNEARSFVEVEANELVDLHRTAIGLIGEERKALHAGLVAYTHAVIDEEWPAMTRRDEATIARIGRKLDVIWKSLHRYEPGSECQKSLHAEALTRFNDLSDARTNRLASARLRMPLGLRVLLYLGAVIVIMSMYMLAVDSFAVHAVITGALGGAVWHVLYVIFDLDDAFAGNWQVSPEPFARVAQRFAEDAP